GRGAVAAAGHVAAATVADAAVAADDRLALVRLSVAALPAVAAAIVVAVERVELAAAGRDDGGQGAGEDEGARQHQRPFRSKTNASVAPTSSTPPPANVP